MRCVRNSLFVACLSISACATPKSAPESLQPEGGADVTFQVDAFFVDEQVEGWVAWTRRGLEHEGRIVAEPGSGCLPRSGWPGLILFVPGEPGGFWLYGTEPQLSGEADVVTFDCFVNLDGETRDASFVPVRLNGTPAPDDNFGFEPAPWHQTGQSPKVTIDSPLGPREWELSADREPCWLRGHDEGAWSACLPTPNTPNFEVKSWVSSPEGLVVGETALLDLPAMDRGEARVWLETSGRVVVATTVEPGRSRVWIRADSDEDRWSAASSGDGGVEIAGAVTSAIFDGTDTYLLTTDFDSNTYRLVEVVGDEVETRVLPNEMRPTRLHLAEDGTLWGSGIGAAWRLRRP